jgi:hypothetical protein
VPADWLRALSLSLGTPGAQRASVGLATKKSDQIRLHARLFLVMQRLGFGRSGSPAEEGTPKDPRRCSVRE